MKPWTFEARRGSGQSPRWEPQVGARMGNLGAPGALKIALLGIPMWVLMDDYDGTVMLLVVYDDNTDDGDDPDHDSNGQHFGVRSNTLMSGSRRAGIYR